MNTGIFVNLDAYLAHHMELPRRHHPITAHDLIPMDMYGSFRDDFRKMMITLKKERRVHVGPDITFYFENRLTLLWQIHEMLFIEKGGDAQIDDELRAYNPLVPQQNECVATMMIEIPMIERRQEMLKKWGYIERYISLSFGNQQVQALFEEDVERTTVGGKTSSVHFLTFPFTGDVQASFCQETDVFVCINHPEYTHTAKLSKHFLNILQNEMASK